MNDYDLGWTGMRGLFDSEAISVVDEAVSRVIEVEFPGRGTNYLTTEALSWQVLDSLHDAGFTITKNTTKENA